MCGFVCDVILLKRNPVSLLIIIYNLFPYMYSNTNKEDLCPNLKKKNQSLFNIFM